MLGTFQPGNHVFCRFLSHPFQLRNGLHIEPKQIRRGPDKLTFQQLHHQRRPDGFHIQGPPRAEVQNSLAYLIRTVRVCAKPINLAVFVAHFVIAGRTGFRRQDWQCIGGPCGSSDRDDFRNDLSAFLQRDQVAKVQVEVADLLEIVEGCSSDHRTVEFDRIDQRDGRDHSGASHAKFDAPDARFCLFGGKFVGRRPAWGLGRDPKLLLCAVGIHFQNHTVNGIGQFGVAWFPPAAIL